jgi:hypothetical protein
MEGSLVLPCSYCDKNSYRNRYFIRRSICHAGVHFTSGPSETFATRDEALAAGRAWRNAQQQP